MGSCDGESRVWKENTPGACLRRGATGVYGNHLNVSAVICEPPFEYAGHTIGALRSSVSPERLQRYEDIAAGDTKRPLRLYMWNIALSESLYGPIQGLEVTLHNRIHQRFADQFGARRYDNPRVGLQYAQRDQVLRAMQSLQHQGKPVDPPRLVAELSFGFWVGLFGRRYETHLWRPHLRQLFVNASRADSASAVEAGASFSPDSDWLAVHLYHVLGGTPQPLRCRSFSTSVAAVSRSRARRKLHGPLWFGSGRPAR